MGQLTKEFYLNISGIRFVVLPLYTIKKTIEQGFQNFRIYETRTKKTKSVRVSVQNPNRKKIESLISDFVKTEGLEKMNNQIFEDLKEK